MTINLSTINVKASGTQRDYADCFELVAKRNGTAIVLISIGLARLTRNDAVQETEGSCIYGLRNPLSFHRHFYYVLNMFFPMA